MMKTIITLCLVLLVSITHAQTYSSIANGNWSSASTWKNGQVPPTTINNNQKIIIAHTVVYNRSNDLDIRKGTVKIYEGELKTPFSGTGSGRSIFIRDQGFVFVQGGKITLPIKNSNGGNLSGNMNIEGGKLELINASLEIAQNWKNEENASLKMVSSCIRLGENYETKESKEILDHTCLEIGLQGSGNYKNDKGDIRVRNASILLRGTSGNFKNASGNSKIRKYANAQFGFSSLDMPGNLTNDGIWDAPIDNYCVGQSITGSRAGDIDFTKPENCEDVNITNCDCSPLATTVLPGAGWAQFSYEKVFCFLPEICSFPINYYFDSTINGANIPWNDVNGPNVYGKVTVANQNYTEAEGRAIFNTPNTATGLVQASKRGFTMVATLKLSNTNYTQEPTLLAAVNTIQLWLATLGKLSPTNLPVSNPAVMSASDVIAEWIWYNRCPDRR